jgi:hypothetical protein
MANSNDKKKPAPKPVKKSPKTGGSSPGSRGLGAYYGGVKNNPAILPGVREQ